MSKNLKVLRKVIDFSQTDMANKLKMSLTTYSNKENGKIQFVASEMSDVQKVLKEHGLEYTIDEIFFKREVTIKVT